MIFGCIDQINPGNKESWEDKVFISIDVDWATDRTLAFVVEDLLLKHGVPATLFMTHRSNVIAPLIPHQDYVIGIHPNFNPLLEGQFTYGKNYREVIDYYSDLYPEAIAARSHSMAMSAHISDYFYEKGIRYDLNIELATTAFEIAPFVDWNKLIRIPFFWQEISSTYHGWELNPARFIQYGGLKVFNFHPIHLLLNTCSFESYLPIKQYYHDDDMLMKHINTKTYGTRDFFLDLVNMVNGQAIG